MINSPRSPSGADEPRDADIEAIVRGGPRGAIAVAGIATFHRRRAVVCFLSFRLPAAGDDAMSERDVGPADRRASGSRLASSVVGRRSSILIMAVFVAMAAFAGIHQATMPQARVETANPTHPASRRRVRREQSRQRGRADGSVTVRAIGQQFSFTPQCMVVPTDTLITFRATSADVVHGFLIEGTNINTMLVPGYISLSRRDSTSRAIT